MFGPLWSSGVFDLLRPFLGGVGLEVFRGVVQLESEDRSLSHVKTTGFGGPTTLNDDVGVLYICPGFEVVGSGTDERSFTLVLVKQGQSKVRPSYFPSGWIRSYDGRLSWTTWSFLPLVPNSSSAWVFTLP